MTGFLGAGAIQTNPVLLPLVFGVALFVVLVSGVVGGTMLMGLRPKRRSVRTAQVGTPFRVRYEVRSCARILPSFALQIAESAHKKNDGWKRYFSEEGGVGRAFIAQIGPGEAVEAIGTFDPTRRGVCEFTGVEVSSGFPFGLFHKLIEVTQPATLLIRPRVRRLHPSSLPRLLSRDGAESPTSRKQRSGDEFYALREYVPGDSPRFIAWRTSARAGTLVVREHSERLSRRIRAVLLVSARAADEDRERAIELFASLVNLMVGADVTVRAEMPQTSSVFQDVGAHTIGPVLDALARFEARGEMGGALPPSRDATIVVRTDEATGLVSVGTDDAVLTSSDLERLASDGGDAP